MNLFKKTRLLHVALISVVSILSVTGMVFAAGGNSDSVSSHIEARLQAAVEAGKLTQEEADAKRDHFGEAKNFHKGDIRRIKGQKDIEARLQAAVEAGKLTQEEADAKRDEFTMNIKRNFNPEAIASRIQGAVNRGLLTQEHANVVLNALPVMKFQ